MRSRLVNVRLDPERVRKAEILRERGVVLSDVVREAIDERFASLAATSTPADVRTMIRTIFEKYPDSPGQQARRYNVHDRAAARRAIVKKLRADRP